MIGYGKQSISDADIAAVVDVLRSPYMTQGPQIAEFEQKLCAYTGAKYCVLVSNGTAALHIAVASLGLEKGSEGITTPITFTASANSMLYCGMTCRFADIDPDTFCLSPVETEKKITSETRLLTPVHFAGRVCDMEAFAHLAQRHHLRVIEDAAHAIGSQYPCGAKVGSCKYSDLTIFSFHPVKTITTGEGGAVMTNDETLYRRLLLFRSHGITKDPAFLTQNPGPWYYEMQALGFNYRMTDFQAALGISQMERLEQFRQRRLEIVKIYNKAFRGVPHFQIPSEKNLDDLCFHLYAARIDYAACGTTRAEFMRKLREKGVGSQVHYIPVHLQPYYREHFGYKPGDMPNAEAFYEQELSLPLYPDLTEQDIQTVIESVKECIKSV